MTGSQRLVYLFGLQHRLALLRLAEAQISLAAAQARADLLDDMANGLVVHIGNHRAGQLAAQGEMAQRLGGARGAMAQGVTTASADRDQRHRTVQRLDMQRRRLEERQRPS